VGRYQDTIEFLEVDRIHANPDNPRKEAGDVTDLANSIEEIGMVQPVSVRGDSRFGTGHYILDSGLRRWTAARLAGTAKIPARIYMMSPGEDPVERTLLVGLSDVHSEELNPMEKAFAFARLRDLTDPPRPQNDIGRLCGVTGATVSYYLSLLELSVKTQEAVANGRVSVELAVKSVRQERARKRRKKGHKPSTAGWEPDAFNEKHFLSRKAKALCDSRGHSNRRRHGGACHGCWETTIRMDEAKVQQIAWREQGYDLPYQDPATNLLRSALTP